MSRGKRGSSQGKSPRPNWQSHKTHKSMTLQESSYDCPISAEWGEDPRTGRQILYLALKLGMPPPPNSKEGAVIHVSVVNRAGVLGKPIKVKLLTNPMIRRDGKVWWKGLPYRGS